MRYFIIICLVQPALSGWAASSLHQQIDQLISAKAGRSVASRSIDTEFFRRVKLDLTGRIPSAGAVHAFLGNTPGDQPTTLLDQLLSSDAFATHWTDRLSVMLRERQILAKLLMKNGGRFWKRH